MNKSNFPSIDTLKEKIKQGCQATELFTLIGKSLSLLNSKPSDDYTHEEKKFLKEHLCQVISIAIEYNHKEFLHESILNLFIDVINLTISTKFNPYVIESLIPFFNIDSHKPHIFKVTTVLLNQIYDFSTVSISSNMKIINHHNSSINEKLLKAFFSKSVLNIAISMVKTNDLDIQQTGAIMNFFTAIQYFLDEELSLSLCIFFSQYSLKILTIEQYGLDGVGDILQFYSTFMSHISSLQTEIFHLTIDMLRFQTQNQYDALLLFLLIIQEPQFLQSSKIIKKTLISLLQQTSNPDIFKEVYSFFPILAKQITFTAEDLTNLICHIRKLPNDANLCVLCLFPSIQSQLNTPINNILLGLNLISCTENDALANLIFVKTISIFDKKINLTPNNFKITDKIINFIISDLNQNSSELNLINLGYFLSNFPRYDLVFEYIMKIIEQDNFECFSTVLKRLSTVSNQFEGEKILSTFSHTLIDQFIGRKFAPRISRLSEIVANWIQNFSSVPESQIMTKLLNIDYSKCPDEVPSIVSAIMSRASNRRVIRQLINKIMKDTVPERHASWAMNMAFDAIHDEKRDIERIAEILFQLLYENSKKTNVIYMIYQAVLYEADFYNVGKKEKSNGLLVEALLNDQPFTFTIHPLHSARRIYTEAGKFLQKRLSNFTLYIKDKEILPDQPLTVIPLKFNNEKKLRITAKIGENENRNDYCRLYLQPIFIEFIQRSERFTSLFNLMNNFSTESEILFLMLNMIDNEMIKPVLSSPIQQIFKKDYFMSLVDLESFRLFPFVLDAARGNKTVYSSTYLSTVFQILSDQSIDYVSLFMSCKHLSSCSANSCEFQTMLIRKCLITSNKKLIRETMAEILTKTDETEKLLSLLSSSAQLQNRSKTKQYFSLLKMKNISPYFVEPLLCEINQYETDFDGNIDQTLNGILRMNLVPTKISFDKVFELLFSPPTVCSPYLPYLHKEKSRKNAYKFIVQYEDCMKKLSPIISMVPMNSKVMKLNDNFSHYKRGFISPLNMNSSVLVALYSVEAIRNYIIKTKFDSLELNELSNLFLEMNFTCLPSINLNSYPLIKNDGTIDTILSNVLNRIKFDQGFSTPFFDIFHIKCQQNEKSSFEEKCQKILDIEKKKVLFIIIDRKEYSKFKFPLFFGNYLLTAAVTKSDDNDNYSVIYRGREINDINNIMNVKDNYLFDIYNRKCWFIAENNEISKYDISDLPEHCFGGEKKKQSAFLLVYEDKDIDVPKLYVSRERQEQINLKNASVWPSVVCNSRGFINFFRELFEKDIDNYLTDGYDIFFKIAIIDDIALRDWKELLINRVLIDEKKSQIFIENFISNETLIEKVDFSESGTFILPELFSAAISNFDIDLKSITKMISKFDIISSQKQFGFACDIITTLLTSTQFDLITYHNLLKLLTKLHKKINSIYTIYDRVLKCFDSLIGRLSSIINDTNNGIVNDIVQTDFLNLWFDVAKKSEAFKKWLESLLLTNPEKCSQDSSLLIDSILDTSISAQSSVTSVAQNVAAPSVAELPKKTKNAKLIKRKNRQNIENYVDANGEYVEQAKENYDEFNDLDADAFGKEEDKANSQNNETIITAEEEANNITSIENVNSENENEAMNSENEVIGDEKGSGAETADMNLSIGENSMFAAGASAGSNESGVFGVSIGGSEGSSVFGMSADKAEESAAADIGMNAHIEGSESGMFNMNTSSAVTSMNGNESGMFNMNTSSADTSMNGNESGIFNMNSAGTNINGNEGSMFDINANESGMFNLNTASASMNGNESSMFSMNSASASMGASNANNDDYSYYSDEEEESADDENQNENQTQNEGEIESGEEEEEEEEDEEEARAKPRVMGSSSNDSFLNGSAMHLMSSSTDNFASNISNEFLSSNDMISNSNSTESFIANDAFMNVGGGDFLGHGARQSEGRNFAQNEDAGANESRGNNKDSNDHLPFEFELKTDSPMSDSSMS